MYLVDARLRHGFQDDRHQALDAEELRALITETAGPGSGLEHVYVQTTPGRVSIQMWILAPTLEDAEARGLRVLDGLLRSRPVEFELLSCSVELVDQFLFDQFLSAFLDDGLEP